MFNIDLKALQKWGKLTVTKREAVVVVEGLIDRKCPCT